MRRSATVALEAASGRIPDVASGSASVGKSGTAGWGPVVTTGRDGRGRPSEGLTGSFASPSDTGPTVADGRGPRVKLRPVMLLAVDVGNSHTTVGVFEGEALRCELRLATRRGWGRLRGGFIHVPWLPEQGTPSMPLADIVRGLRVAVRVALTTSQDLHLTAGQIS